MSKLNLILVFSLFLGISACISQNDFARVDESELDTQKITYASELADRILKAQKEGGYYAFQENEATEQMIDGLNEKAQKKSYMSIRAIFGDYEDLEFDHMMKSKSGSYIGVYRFKGSFKEQKSDVEIRVVLNDQDQLAGFFIRPWRESL